jgi:aryl-alcohol dehydrogenase-like predicted oxidoreductase
MPDAPDFLRGRLGSAGHSVFRLGISGSYRPGERVLRRALDEGIDYIFSYGFDGQTIRVLRDLPASARDRVVIATGAYNFIWWRQDFRKTLEKRLRQLHTDRIDVFHFLGIMNPKQFGPRAQDALQALRADPRVGAVAVSCHDRTFAADLACRGIVDAVMIRYNAAHRGAEREIFPRLGSPRPGVVSYTATRWTALLRRPRVWPADRPVPTAGQCYRFVLGNPNVDVCLMAPRSERELLENLTAVQAGPLAPDEDAWMREFGDVVHARAGWFM